MRAGERSACCARSPAGSGAGEGEVTGRAQAVTCARCGEFGASTPRSPVAVDARGRDQRGQTVDELQGREAQLRGAIGLRPGEAIDNLLVTDLFQPLQRKGRARAIA